MTNCGCIKGNNKFYSEANSDLKYSIYIPGDEIKVNRMKPVTNYFSSNFRNLGTTKNIPDSSQTD